LQRKDTIRTPVDINRHQELVRLNKKEHAKVFKRLKKSKAKSFDRIVHEIHDDVFSCTDCLKCANCCKTTSPLVTDRDTDRISKHLKIKSSSFESKYLMKDDEGDFVMNATPCPFLMTDNACSIYNVRPKACREFPHTDRVKQKQILHLTEKNVIVCPAVYEIVEKLKSSALNK
jgi:Fe-S-cluster containining protein